MKPITEADLEQLSAYIDGELSDSERRFFQKRLSNDAELRDACERAWIASSVLKAHPMNLMPARNAESICAQCQPESRELPWRLVASFAALAMITGLGYRYLDSNNSGADLQPQVAQATPAVPTETATGALVNAGQGGAASAALAQSQTAPLNGNGSSAILDDPTQFALNEAALAKSWPKRDQVMEDYLVRHNQMSGANGNDLISYAQMLTEPAPASEEAQDNQ